MSVRPVAAPAPAVGTTSASRLAAVLAAGVARVQGAMMETGPPTKRPNDEVLGYIDTQPGRSNAGGRDDGDGDLPFFDAPPVPPAAAGPSDDGKVEFADPPVEGSGDGKPKSKKKGNGGQYAFPNAHQNFRASVMEWFVAKERLAVYEIVADDPTYPVDDMLKRLTEQWEKTEYNGDDKNLQAQKKKAIALAKKYSSERSKFRKWDYPEAFIEFAKQLRPPQDISQEYAEELAKVFRDQSGNPPIGRFDGNNKYVEGWTKRVTVVELHIKMITDVLETLQKLKNEANNDEQYATNVKQKITELQEFVKKRYDMEPVPYEFESKSDQKVEYGVKYYVDRYFGPRSEEEREAGSFAEYRKGFLNEDQLLGWDATPEEDYKNHSRNRMLISMQAFDVLSDVQKLSSELVLAQRTVYKPVAGAVPAAEKKKRATEEAGKKAEKIARDAAQAVESSKLTEEKKEAEMQLIRRKLQAANAQKEARLLHGDQKQEALAELEETSAAVKLAAEQARETARAEKAAATAARQKATAERAQQKAEAAAARKAAREAEKADGEAQTVVGRLKTLLSNSEDLLKEALERNVGYQDYVNAKKKELEAAIAKSNETARSKAFNAARRALTSAKEKVARLEAIEDFENVELDERIKQLTTSRTALMDRTPKPQAEIANVSEQIEELEAARKPGLEPLSKEARQAITNAARDYEAAAVVAFNKAETDFPDLAAAALRDQEGKAARALSAVKRAEKKAYDDARRTYERSQERVNRFESIASNEHGVQASLDAAKKARDTKKNELDDKTTPPTDTQSRDLQDLEDSVTDLRIFLREDLDDADDGAESAEDGAEQADVATPKDVVLKDALPSYEEHFEKLKKEAGAANAAYENAQEMYYSVHAQYLKENSERAAKKEADANEKIQKGLDMKANIDARVQAMSEKLAVRKYWLGLLDDRDRLLEVMKSEQKRYWAQILGSPENLVEEAVKAGVTLDKFEALVRVRAEGNELVMTEDEFLQAVRRRASGNDFSKDEYEEAYASYKDWKQELKAAELHMDRGRSFASENIDRAKKKLAKLNAQYEKGGKKSKSLENQIEQATTLLEIKALDDATERSEKLQKYLRDAQDDVEKKKAGFQVRIDLLPEYHAEQTKASAKDLKKDDDERRKKAFKYVASRLDRKLGDDNTFVKTVLAMEEDRKSMADSLRKVNEAGVKTKFVETSSLQKWSALGDTTYNGTAEIAQVPFTNEQYASMFLDAYEIIKLTNRIVVETSSPKADDDAALPQGKKPKVTYETPEPGRAPTTSFDDLFDAAEKRVAQMATGGPAEKRKDRDGAPAESTAETTVPTRTNALKPTSDATLQAAFKTRPLVVNRSFVYELMLEHVRSMQEVHTKSVENSKGRAIFANVGSALDDSAEESAALLVDFFSEMVTYKFTALAAKVILLAREYDAIKVGGTRQQRVDAVLAFEALSYVKFPDVARGVLESGKEKEKTPAASAKETRRKRVKKTVIMTPGSKIYRLHTTHIVIPSEWESRARLMIMGEEGRLPGQLASPQPTFLPLRIAAPPRVGKSATALLVATLGRRLGMKLFYSVSPNKSLPIAELEEKLDYIGWGNLDQNRICNKYDFDRGSQALQISEMTRLAAKELVFGFRAFKIDDEEVGSNPLRLNMKVSYPPKQHVAVEGVKRLIRKDAIYEDTYDMLMYSSDKPLSDMERVAGLLETYRLSKWVVFHIRDEAQSLAKEEGVMVPSGKEGKEAKNAVKSFHLPPPMLLNLRHCYSNMYGLNCLVTATHFGTLLEEPLYGYFGSIGQNGRAGLPISADTTEIDKRIGTFTLPNVVPALRPARSKGYLGVDDVVVWNGQHLELGTMQSALAGDRNSEFVVNDRGNVVATKVKTKVEDVVNEVDVTPPPPRRSGRTRKVLSAPTKKDLEEVKKAKPRNGKGTVTDPPPDDEPEEKKQTRRADEQKAARLDMNQAALLAAIADDEDDEEGGGGGRKKRDEDNEYVITDSDDSDGTNDDDGPTQGAPKRPPKPCSTPEDLLKCVYNDNLKIVNHFTEWLEAEPLRIETLYQPAERAKDSDRNAMGNLGALPSECYSDAYIFPMYIGALNNKISGIGMASYLRRLAAQAMVTYDEAVDVTFMLYSSVLDTYSQLSEANISVKHPTEEGNISAKDQIQAVDTIPEPQKRDGRPVLVATCFRSEQSWVKGKIDKEVKFVVRSSNNAGNAITYIRNNYPHQKFAFLGYDMFTAGLTVQTVLTPENHVMQAFAREQLDNDEEKEYNALVNAYKNAGNDFVLQNGKKKSEIKHPEDYKAYALAHVLLKRKSAPRLEIYIATYMGFASSPEQGLDTSLQIVGRCFAELKRGGTKEGINFARHILKPRDLKIQLLAPDGLVARLQQYSGLERKLANPEHLQLNADGTKARSAPLYRVLKGTFGMDFLQVQSDGKSLGTVGRRRGSIAEVLGFTAKSAERFAKKVAELRATKAKAENEGTVVEEDSDVILRELAEIESNLKDQRADLVDVVRAADGRESTQTIPEGTEPSNSQADVEMVDAVQAD